MSHSEQEIGVGNFPRIASVKYGDREAIYCVKTGRRFTFAEFNDRVNGLGNGLLQMGLKKGDTCAFLVDNRAEIFETYGALAKIGVIGVPLNCRMERPQMVNYINLSDAETVIFCEDSRDLLHRAVDSLPNVRRYIYVGDLLPEFAISYEELISGASKGEPDVAVTGRDNEFINMTSGTTGLPKPFFITHGANFAALPIFAFAHDVTEKDIILTVMPITGRSGFSWCGVGLFTGAKNVIINFDPIKILEVIQEEKVTITTWIPIIASVIMKLPDLDKYDLSSLRGLVFTGGPLSEKLLGKIYERLCPNVYEYYGLSECGLLTNIGPEEKRRKPGSVGTPYFGAEVKIVNDDGKDMSIGENGEIATKSIALTAGYLKDDKKTRETIVDGWFHTGDIGRLDEDGFLYVVGRREDTLTIGNSSISSLDVENVIKSNEAVIDCAVIVLKGKRGEEILTAVVMRNPRMDITKKGLHRFCSERLDAIETPKKFIFTTNLPRTPTGKIKKYLLTEKYQGS
ncbi:MAG: AMP-binding protein [Deltaproteobacteria bacterium]|uniref:AMP-binding protein n=1 Tax=Candidatus Zymogenus saltonus TaxID=2844893 RepID=A0A9D8PPH3_9DELT|nr:AMP-binding protein [Candidatus Zymogenus saltonus]